MPLEKWRSIRGMVDGAVYFVGWMASSGGGEARDTGLSSISEAIYSLSAQRSNSFRQDLQDETGLGGKGSLWRATF